MHVLALQRRSLHDRMIGAMVAVLLAFLLTMMRIALDRMLPIDVIPDFIFYLSATIVVGWRWGRLAALISAGTNLVFLSVIPLDVTVAKLFVGTPIYLVATGYFVYLIQLEQTARARAERERDQSREAERKVTTEFRYAEEVAREQRRILQMLQRGTLVASEPGIEGLSFAVAYEPARVSALVGGDFYGAFALSPTRLAVVLGDVTGKGVEAAASGVMVSNMLRAFFRESSSPAEVLSRLNAALSADPEFTLFTTLFAAVVDGMNGTLVYANAGQEAPCLLDPRGGVTQLETTGVTIGIVPDARYEERRLEVPPGHTLAAFTDGLTEIRRNDGTWIQPELAYQRLGELAARPPEEIVREMIAWARALAPGGTLRDDAALVAIRFEGNEGNKNPHGTRVPRGGFGSP